MYYFIGRVATLTKKEKERLCTFNVETSVKINGEYMPIAYTCDQEKQFISAPGSFKVSEKLFDFISQHSREKLKIGFEIDTKAKANNAESTASGTGEQGNNTKNVARVIIKEVTLQNE